MATAKAARRTVFLDTEQAPDVEVTDLSVEANPVADDDADASLCPGCGEPLTWHEQPCAATGSTPATLQNGPPAGQEAEAPAARPAGGSFAYALGRLVMPATQQQAHPVVWRGQLRERSPATGLVHRINVYRLSDGHWDCYREEELQAA